MKLIIPRTDLKTALDGLGKVVPRKSALPVLQCIRVDGTIGQVRASATDLDQVVACRLESATVEGKPAVWLLELEQLRALTDGNGDKVEIEAKNCETATAVKYVGGHPIQHTLRLQDTNEWPEFKNTIPVTETDCSFLEQYRKVLAFTLDDPSRYVLNGVYLDVSDKRGHYIVATDGRRLTAYNTLRFPLTESLVLPTSRFLAWNKLTGGVAIGAHKANGVQWFRLTVGNWDYAAKATDGMYPNWRQVVPSEDGGTNVVIGDADRDMLKSVLRTFPGHDVTNAPIRLSKRSGKLFVSGKGSEDKNWTDLELPNSRLEGKSQAIGVSRCYLLDALDAGFNTFAYADEHGPLVARNGAGVHVLMPLRTSDEPPTRTNAKAAATTTTKENAMKESENGKPELSAMDRLLAAYDLAKQKIREANDALATIAVTVKEVLREDKQRRAEIDSVRAGLARLQAIKV